MIGTVLAASAILAIVFGPPRRVSIDRVHPAFRSIKSPFRAVVADYYLDGGSLGIRIIGNDGATNDFALPVNSSRDEPRYGTLFVGTLYQPLTNRDGGFPLDLASKQWLSRVVEEEAPRDGSRAIVLFSLRGSPKDHLRILTRRVLRLE
jgi:hypothetical protein